MTNLPEISQINKPTGQLKRLTVDKLRKEAATAPAVDSNLLIVKTADEWISEALSEPAQLMLFGPLWFTGETCVLFAETNVGKTILAVQIGMAISKGQSVLGLAVEGGPRKVLYCDFELSKRQFANRYTEEGHAVGYFGENFLRVEMNAEAETPEGEDAETYTAMCIEQIAKDHGVSVIIVDNISYLKSDTEKARQAVPFMQYLTRMKRRDGLSLLIIAHTPKRSPYEPLSINDIAGSAAVGRFIDSAFAIGKSQIDPQLRYLKQVKERNTHKVHGGDNVIICELTKSSGFLEFAYLREEHEMKHLKRQNGDDQEERNAEIYEAYKEKNSLREVANIFGISHQTVKRVVERMKGEENQV